MTVMYAIDPKAGTHFVGKIFVRPHACDRAVEHFGVERSKAPMYVMDLLRKSSLVSEHVVDEDGNPGRMFSYKRTVFIVHPTEDTVFTLYPQHKAHESVRNPIERIILRAMKAAERKEKREIKRINVRMAEITVERAQAELRRVKSESARIVAEMTARIAEIDSELKALEREILLVQREKTNVMKSVVAYV
ncbi:hypothetical protein [Paenibacillus sp. UASWS1643]|uniref:hypothetical protein n=1 Tax=Paenibacillus sp. UASWS1643 TaxID=2580422 RepID=UPI00123B9510|nr:hypothetical protein [Paenibacillus sp. UASWS1643]KAA8750184.1 hypothetical protein FE296_16465 [Paenibacillus sp. UASWS1643]